MRKNKHHIMMEERYLHMDQNQKLVMNLRDAGHMLRFLFEGKGSQKRILMILSEEDGMTQRELTERIGIKPGSASEVIGKLETAGLIERKSNEADRRTTDIYLTAQGANLAKEAKEQRRIRHQEMFACLDDEEKESLLVLLEKLNQDWDSRYHTDKKDHDDHHKGHHGHQD